MNISDSFSMAAKTLVANKLRSSLTMLGIVIGNASVIAMISIGEGTQKLATDQLSYLGPNTIFVVPGSPKSQDIIDGGVEPTLVLSDAEAIATQLPTTIDAVAPALDDSLTIGARNVVTSTLVTGTTAKFTTVRNFRVKTGRFITDADLKSDRRIAILGPDIAKTLFGSIDPLTKQIRIKNVDFEVVGVMQPKGSSFGFNLDEIIYIPITAMSKQIIGQKSPYGIKLSYISAVAKNSESIEAAEFQMANLLRIRHKLIGENDFVIDTQKSALKTVGTITNGLTILLGAIAGISLFVGGIGVMNIMLVSVTERTQEIGLRKAIGATQQDILIQFTIEAVILSTIGGIIGIAIGIGCCIPIGQFTPLQAAASPSAILLAVGVSSTIGLFFGIVPAKQAAKLDPIAALRTG
jgi:putative ABC transport system permease protein